MGRVIKVTGILLNGYVNPLTFVEKQRPDLGAAIIHKARRGVETGHGGYSNNMTFACLKHARKKLLDQDKMRREVDFENPVGQLGRAVDHGRAASWTGIAMC